MTGLLAELVESGRAALFTVGVVFLRVGALMAMLPAFGENSVPERVKLVLALAFTLVVAPAVLDRVAPLVTMDARMLPLLATETVIGLSLGVALRLFIWALQIAGTIAAQSISMSQIFGDAGVDPAPAISHFMVMGGLALAVILGLHVRVAELLIYSYEVLEPGQLPGAGALSEWGVGRIAAAFGLAFSLAAPFTIASFIYNLALGVINRAMPQLMVIFIGAPAITLGGLILMFLALPLLLGLWAERFFGFIAAPFGGS